MDAEWIENQRDSFHSQREKRWSMNSQRLEEIVAELMRPISNDHRRSFDTDLSALLEEYLTEAGLHALEEAEGGSPCADAGLPNFAEIALLLQQSAAIYGRKVDCLYQHVLRVSEAVHNSIAEAPPREGEPAQAAPAAARRRRRASAEPVGEFVDIVLEPCAAATREREAPRPPPTLSRTYVELEPRVAGAADLPLYDYSDEHIGMLTDFHVAWRLHDGMLVDELQGGAHAGAGGLRALSLVELQAALEARAPSSPPTSLRPACHSTPLPSPRGALPDDDADAGASADELAPHVLRRERKRRSAVHIDHLFDDHVKIIISKDLMRKLGKVQHFCVDDQWIETVVKRRKSNILSARKLLAQQAPPEKGFRGWSRHEVALATDAVLAMRSAYGDLESDDDGFFEQSGEEDNAHPKAVTLARTDAARANQHIDDEPRDADTELPSGDAPAQGEQAAEGEALAAATTPVQQAAVAVPLGAVPPAPHEQAVEVLADVTPLDPEAAARAAALAAWRADVLRRAAESEARGAPDVRALGDQLVHALEGAEREPRAFAAVLRDEAKHDSDVSRLMLTTLFLANSGNVEIVCGPPLSLNSFSLRLKSRDTSRYAQAAAAARELFS